MLISSFVRSYENNPFSFTVDVRLLAVEYKPKKSLFLSNFLTMHSHDRPSPRQHRSQRQQRWIRVKRLLHVSTDEAFISSTLARRIWSRCTREIICLRFGSAILGWSTLLWLDHFESIILVVLTIYQAKLIRERSLNDWIIEQVQEHYGFNNCGQCYKHIINKEIF